MCSEAISTIKRERNSYGCGGHTARAALNTPFDLRSIRALSFAEPAQHQCNCGRACPRKYLSLTGFALGGFLVMHFAANLLGLWPERFQSMVTRNHSLGMALPVLEIGLIFIPLSIHIAFGLRTLSREKLKFGIKKHHGGSDLRNWMQRASAIILLAFILFHVATMHRWLGGRFDSHNAFNSASQTIWKFWSDLPAGHPANMLIAQLFLLGIAAAVYHLTNGIATGAEVLCRIETEVPIF